MKRVLIITYYFPPRPAVGSLRPSGLAKYLPEFGWETTILTSRLPGGPSSGFEVIETDYVDAFGFWKDLLGLDAGQNLLTQMAQLRKKFHIKSERSVLDFLVTRLGEITAYPDPQKRWRPFAIKAGHEFLQHESVDAIISTSSPATSHIIARELKEKHGIPWGADFRDLWTQNHYYPYSPLRRAIERRLEKKTLREADALVTVCEPAADKLRELHTGKPIHIVTNGFDPDEVNYPESDLTSKFTITYTGNLYPGKQSAEPLFAALSDSIARGTIDASDTEVRFFGAEAGWIDKQARQYGLTDVVRQYGIVPREIALEKQRESQLLLFIQWPDPAEGYYSAKIFEYLAARRPILAIGGYDDVASKLLNETKAGIQAATTQGLRITLEELYNEFKVAGRVGYKGDEDAISRYS
ncbi:MAG: glycosyltransferase, partial [Dehalococcoidia bacterium]